MSQLDHLTFEELWELLEGIEDRKPTQRILAAIAFKQGDSTDRLAYRHNVSKQTIRNWIYRFEDRPLEAAPFDESRPGRPRKLQEEELQQLKEDLRVSPSACGYNQQTWNSKLVSEHLRIEYQITYSRRQVSRLMQDIARKGEDSVGD